MTAPASDDVRAAPRARWYETGEEPDYRFTYANERTLLAWVRTALALLAMGVAVRQLAPDLGRPGGGRILGGLVVAAATIVSPAAYCQWRANETAMRQRRALPHNSLVLVLSACVTAGAAVVVTLLALP